MRKGETVDASAEGQIRRHIDVEKLADLFRRLQEDFNGYERRVIQAYLQDVNCGSSCCLRMGVLETLGIESTAAKQRRRWEEDRRRFEQSKSA